MPVIHNYTPQPLVNVIADGVRYTSVISLTPGQKQQVWKGIKKTDPALAELLKDEDFKAMTEAFGARVQFPIEELNRYMQAGQTD